MSPNAKSKTEQAGCQDKASDSFDTSLGQLEYLSNLDSILSRRHERNQKGHCCNKTMSCKSSFRHAYE